MQNLKQKLSDQGLAGALVLRENGARIPLRFTRGETSKAARLTLGPVNIEVELRLVEVPGATPEQPNLTLVILPADRRTSGLVDPPSPVAATPPATSVETPPETPPAAPPETPPETPPEPSGTADTVDVVVTDDVDTGDEKPKTESVKPTTTTTSNSGGRRNR